MPESYEWYHKMIGKDDAQAKKLADQSYNFPNLYTSGGQQDAYPDATAYEAWKMSDYQKYNPEIDQKALFDASMEGINPDSPEARLAARDIRSKL